MSTSPIFLFLDKAKDQWQPVEWGLLVPLPWAAEIVSPGQGAGECWVGRNRP